jgi:hypothetical protein
VSLRSIIIRSTGDGYLLVDQQTNAVLGPRFESLQAALAAARRHGASRVLHQSVDNRGRPLGEAVPLNAPETPGESGQGSTA